MNERGWTQGPRSEAKWDWTEPCRLWNNAHGQPEVMWSGLFKPHVMPPLQKNETLTCPVCHGITVELRQIDMSASVREMIAS